MKCNFKKVLFGLSVSLVLAMAIGSFAIGENQTPVTPLAAEPISDEAGAFTVTATDGETVLTDNDYSYSGGVLTIKSTTPMTIKNTNTGSTTDRIVIGSESLQQGNTVSLTLAGVNIDRSSITTAEPAALTITDNATFNVNIFLKDDTENTLKGAAGYRTFDTDTSGSPGIQKNGDTGVGMLTITGSVGENAGKLTATGGVSAAGIGGGNNKSGSDITISGGTVTATGGFYGAGIGGGNNGSGSDNSLNGDAVVLATSGNASKLALEGFVDEQGESLLTQGIAFTGLGTAFDSDGHATDVTWDSNGTMYGDSVAISQNAEFPADLTIDNDKEITLEAGKTLTISAGATLTNEGTINIGEGGNITCQHDEATGTTGEVTTKTDFYREGSTDVYATGYQTYQTSAGVQKYTNLPNPDQTFINWYYVDQDGRKTKIDENSFVALNAHSFYENLYAISIAKQGEGEITPNVTEAAKDDTVTFEATPADGYELKEESVIVTDADGNEVPVTEEDGKYTFTMPGADVEISAEFELLPTPEPSVDPGHGGDGSDASSKTGDSFAGIAALAILGVATTGAVLVRKRK